MNLTVFGFLNIAEYNTIKMNFNDFKGLFKTNPSIVLAYTISIIGLAGFPITSGFIAKIYLFSAIAHSGLIFLPFLIALLILTVVAVFYYLKILHPLFEKIEQPIILSQSFSQKFVIFFTIFVTVLIGIYPEKLAELCRFIAYNI